jgi:GntR family transcriptional regulator, transcriptional repressor for pyruvate dehydrogenase complex
MNVQPVIRQSLADVVVQRIRDLIDQGTLRAGDALPGEQELGRQLQVSRPVLREALGRLESLGLVTMQRGQGRFVADRGGLASCAQLIQSALAIAPKDLLKYAEVRWGIECYAARRAAELAGPEDLAALEQCLDQMDRSDVDYLESIRIDFRFHRLLIDITGNEVMQNLMEVIHEFVMAGMVRTTPKPRDRSWSRPLHQAILDAVRSANPEAAEEAMRVHMEAVVRRLRAAGKNQERPARR